MSQEKMEKTFSVAAPARLNLSNIRGSVDIRPGDEGVLSITVIKHTDTGDAGNTKIELSQAVDGTVSAATNFSEGWWLWLVGSRPCKVDYLVKAPRACSLHIKGVSNKVFAEGFEGSFDFNSVSGDLTLQNLAGSLRLNTVSGNVAGSGLSGSLYLETVSGDVDLTESTLESVNAKTVSGDLRLQTSAAGGPYCFNSVSGDVFLTLPASSRFEADLHSVSGNLSSAFPATSHSYGHGSSSLTVQGGGMKVSLRSVSGNLRLQNAGRVQPAVAQDMPASNVDRHAILERIERGEITADEGLALIS